MVGLESVVERIAKNTTLLTSSEEATRQAAILPILAQLDWEWTNIDEVVPEYGAGAGRVDYCLRHHGRSLVFIEVKRAGTDLQPHQEQLLRYAFHEGVGLAVLSDGLVWWLYLPTAPGSWEQRRFYSLDVRRVTPGRAASVLESFLSQSAVTSGEAVKRAQAEFAGQERQRRIEEAFPVAWLQLAEGPDELLVELVAEAVAGIAGHAPEPEEVARFLAGLSGGSGVSARTESRPSRRTTVEPKERRSDTTFTGTTPTRVVLEGESFEVATWRDVLLTVCRFLVERDPDFEQRVLPLQGRKRSYFSRTAESLLGPLAVPGSTIFVEGNLSANSIVSLSRTVLRAVRGRDDQLQFIVDDDAPRKRRRSSRAPGDDDARQTRLP